jgi:UDP-N-acetylglucosamine--N-acetylmuramyl-(pentapeptide) pyrophosphoryl-undecaprenol N-acetylglucosamine transferase
MTNPIKVIITGGGTGGHVFPAIAIADALKKIDNSIEILFVGAIGKMEMERVPKAGYEIKGLWISGFQRKWSFQNLLFPVKLFASYIKAYFIVKKFKPDVVVGVGGYASGPVMQAAVMQKIPTVIQEQNGFAGVTNRILAKKVSKICVAYNNMTTFFPEEKIIFTGNPVRQDIIDLTAKKTEAVDYFNLENNKKTILILGGSLGARTLNEAMKSSTDLLKNNDVQVLWQCGKFYVETYKNCATAELLDVKILPFLDRMDLAYSVADVVISRAGALSISELCLVGKPAILVPSPNVAEDHQTKNALALVEKAAARLVKDVDAVEKMMPEAMLILENEAVAHALSESIRQLGRPNAARDIASVIIGLAG